MNELRKVIIKCNIWSDRFNHSYKTNVKIGLKKYLENHSIINKTEQKENKLLSQLRTGNKISLGGF